MHVTGAATAVQFQLLLVVQLPFHPFPACPVLALSSWLPTLLAGGYVLAAELV
jgi:hypothetical protein